MTGVDWLILILYSVGIGISLRMLSWLSLESFEREHPILLKTEEEYKKEYKSIFLLAIIPALLWPLSWTLLGLWKGLDVILRVPETERLRQIRAGRKPLDKD